MYDAFIDIKLGFLTVGVVPPDTLRQYAELELPYNICLMFLIFCRTVVFSLKGKYQLLLK